MEDIERMIGEFDRGELEEGQESEELISNAFLQLRSYCIELLELVRSPKKDASVILSLRLFLQNSSPSTLQPFLE